VAPHCQTTREAPGCKRGPWEKAKVLLLAAQGAMQWAQMDPLKGPMGAQWARKGPMAADLTNVATDRKRRHLGQEHVVAL
jgi:hypothetical protein